VKPESPVPIHSTDEFGRHVFRPHGNWRFWAEGDVIYSVACGPFNVEFVQALAAALKDIWASNAFTRKPGHLVQIERSIMASPEMLAAYRTVHERLPPGRGAAAVAFVVAPEVEGREFMLPLFQKIYDDLGRNFRAFETLPEAEAWVQSHLVERSSPA